MLLRFIDVAYRFYVASLRRDVEGLLILSDEIVGFREGMKNKAKEMTDFKAICDTVCHLAPPGLSLAPFQQQLPFLEAVVGGPSPE